MKVFIVGGNHHNGLNLARILGVCGIWVEALIVCPERKSFVAKSRYVKKTTCFNTNKAAFDYLSGLPHKGDKTFILPYSDGGAAELDSRLDEFKDKFFVPSCADEQGRICSMMDKLEQYNFAENNKIPMPKTMLIDLSDYNANYGLPIVLKPKISAFGNKMDIKMCHTVKEFDIAVEDMRKKGYGKVLAQEIFNYDYEALIIGAIYKNRADISLSVHKVIRQWPVNTGSGWYDVSITDSAIISRCNELLKKIKEYGFCGLIDVEVFIKDGEVYLNEINWRNSGGGYRSVSDGFFYAYWWCMDRLGIAVNVDWDIQPNSYSMAELMDIRHVLSRKYKFKEWLADYHKTKDFALKFKGDMSPAFFRFAEYIFKQWKLN